MTGALKIVPDTPPKSRMQNPLISFRATDEFAARLYATAARNHTSVSSYCRQVLQWAMDQEDAAIECASETGNANSANNK